MRDLVEKPPRDEAPSDLAIIGRYVLTPDIFPALAATKSDRTGEIQLTNGLRELLKTRPIYACEVKGVRHDTGNKLGFLKAVVYFALRRPDLADKFADVPGVARSARRPPANRSADAQELRLVPDLAASDVVSEAVERWSRSSTVGLSSPAIFVSASLSVFSLSPASRRRLLAVLRRRSCSAFAGRDVLLLRVVGDVPAACP